MNTQLIAQSIGKYLSVTLWDKKGVRLYINNYGFNTKKCKQTIYIDLETFTPVCFTDCPGQDRNWCMTQSAIVVRKLQKYVRLARLVSRCKTN